MGQNIVIDINKVREWKNGWRFHIALYLVCNTLEFFLSSLWEVLQTKYLLKPISENLSSEPVKSEAVNKYMLGARAEY